MWFRKSQKGGTGESCGDCTQGGVFQCDECNFAAAINKWMLKQFVVVILNVLTIVNTNKFSVTSVQKRIVSSESSNS